MKGLLNNPFEYCDVVTSTTHKILRGPRGGFIIAKKDLMADIDNSVFPGLQGGPHNNAIAALAVQLKECESDMFKQYCIQVLANSSVLATELINNGFKITTNGTDTHLCLVDLRNFELSGSKFE